MTDLRTLARESQNKLKTAVDQVAPTVAEPEGLPHIEYTDPIEDIEIVPVHVAWVRVMRDIRAVEKGRTATVKTDKGSYSFPYRGIDDVLNATGPALRRHGVRITPTDIHPTYGNAGRMRECLVTVAYAVTGPANDSFTVAGIGEALDVGERATTKALTNAYRNMLVALLCLPTNDPKLDMDVVNLEREVPKPPTPDEYHAEILRETTSIGRLKQIQTDFRAHPDIAAVEYDDDFGGKRITLGALLSRIGNERVEREKRAAQEGPR